MGCINRFLRNRRGIFFTLVSISLLSLLVFSYLGEYEYSNYELSSVIETRVTSMNDFINNFNEDMGKGVYIAGFRSLVGLENHIASTGEFVDNVSVRFGELFLNGTYDGGSEFIMVNNTFADWLEKMQQEAQSIGIALDFSVNDISVFQADPWLVSVSVNLSYNVTDIKGTAFWERSQVVTGSIEIEGFHDPLYTIYTSNNVIKEIARTVYEGNYVSGADVSNLQDHMDNTYYTDFSDAPNFLMRFEGDLSTDPSGNGIESLVDKDEVGIWALRHKKTSSVDYLYWDNYKDNTNGVEGMPSSFVIDDREDAEGNQTHIDKYEVGGLLI